MKKDEEEIAILDYPRSSILRGACCSTILHITVVLALLSGLLRSPSVPPTSVAPVILVNLVQLATTRTSPLTSEKSEIPQQKATERAFDPKPAAVPVPGSREQRTILQPTSPGSSETSRRRKALDILSQEDAMAMRLRQLSRLQQPDTQILPSPENQKGTGLSNRPASDNDPVPGDEATHRVRDFLRAQIERRWYTKSESLNRSHARVSIHILLDPSGNVRLAEIVDDARRHNDPGYQDLAQSARSAVLLSSPLTLLPGSYPVAKDIVIDFDASQLVH